MLFVSASGLIIFNMAEEKAQTIVSVERCFSYGEAEMRQALARALEPLGGIGAFVRDGQRVMLKPNYVLPRPADGAVLILECSSI